MPPCLPASLPPCLPACLLASLPPSTSRKRLLPATNTTPRPTTGAVRRARGAASRRLPVPLQHGHPHDGVGRAL
eukprot:206326-Chlamydomonas_euryale.AAC.9